jgi:hypothetical protein
MLLDLSMGMTNDYPVAIKEGATIVRIRARDLRGVAAHFAPSALKGHASADATERRRKC